MIIQLCDSWWVRRHWASQQQSFQGVIHVLFAFLYRRQPLHTGVRWNQMEPYLLNYDQIRISIDKSSNFSLPKWWLTNNLFLTHFLNLIYMCLRCNFILHFNSIRQRNLTIDISVTFIYNSTSWQEETSMKGFVLSLTRLYFI